MKAEKIIIETQNFNLLEFRVDLTDSLERVIAELTPEEEKPKYEFKLSEWVYK